MEFKFFVCVNSEGQIRLLRWKDDKGMERDIIMRKIREIIRHHNANGQIHSNQLIKTITNDVKIVVKKYNGLYFIIGIPIEEDSLFYLSLIPKFVQQLDLMFNNVCELDLVYNFRSIYNKLDQL